MDRRQSPALGLYLLPLVYGTLWATFFAFSGYAGIAVDICATQAAVLLEVIILLGVRCARVSQHHLWR
jgi:hypothetical protein